jgi:hypothetical protein
MQKTAASPDLVQALQQGVSGLNCDTTHTHRRGCSRLQECEWYHSLTQTLLIEVPVPSQVRL